MTVNRVFHLAVIKEFQTFQCNHSLSGDYKDSISLEETHRLLLLLVTKSLKS